MAIYLSQHQNTKNCLDKNVSDFQRISDKCGHLFTWYLRSRHQTLARNSVWPRRLCNAVCKAPPDMKKTLSKSWKKFKNTPLLFLQNMNDQDRHHSVHCDIFWLIPLSSPESFMEFLTSINPNYPKSSKILQGALSSLLETGTFTASNGAKLLPGKKYRP